MTNHRERTMSAQLDAVLPQALADAVEQVKANSRKWAGVFTDDATRDGFWYARECRDGMDVVGTNHGWTTSFWTGMQWLAFEATGDVELKAAAKAGTADHVRRAYARQDTDTHDLGFLCTLSAVADWRLTGDDLAKAGAIEAADLLMNRFLEPAGIIQAWGDLTDPEQQGRGIIDSLMNLPLLVWAGEQTGDARYLAAVRRHALNIAAHIIRDDDTTFHTYHWDPVTGAPLRGTTHQGANDDSCWSRGQTWGIYGFAMAYQATGEPSLLVAAHRVTDYYLAHLPSNLVPFWDLIFDENSGEERDTSSAGI
ncbi:MAG: glycoside hydrolase family 88 protein, partial [Cellulomonadaceae bacterium]|nr:glycoside hydrolase family 88 protein [Cellulomonadaceae bacterium]